jgi:DNA transposition AAA+ family ATPase
VLSGMAGIGKTECVLQFLKRYNKEIRKKYAQSRTRQHSC